ncbi:transcriptional regulator, TetR family [Clostridium acidisoli DSM 12555]|jgi:AcrR family transcriptional regulator|uniref:Transcriptional regulator, TetR family n=1 Tax=Clostridium acidisoli DSM 12555 TaxID=1121291 RepID=A0A1W1XHD6_9CLOT|nr:TetR/AcrR family transcriptional regulator [Clostridium acidisoli]SMC23426.1 transcriptional regulator, TetR family [Clostridium acidisoli DSM 12555]
MNEQKNGTRRRGEALEYAILEAAWKEFTEVGYNSLTMEGVAARAETNKAVLYRRWSNKSELVIAVLHKYLQNSSNEIPNTGNLRNDVFYFLLELIKPLKKIGTQAIIELLAEHIGSTIISSIPHLIQPGAENKLTAAITAILKNAELRGEINLEKLSMRIISLPVDLVRYELLTRKEPISDEVIEEIVDTIFIPLVHVQAGIMK